MLLLLDHYGELYVTQNWPSFLINSAFFKKKKAIGSYESAKSPVT